MEIVYQLKDRHIEQLHTLYQKESWSKGRTPEETRAVISGTSMVVGFIDDEDNLAAFARVLTDHVFKALIFDVIVDEKYRGDGLGDLLVTTVKKHPKLSKVKHVELYCLPELHDFYQRHGFTTDVGNMRLMRYVSALTGNASK